MIPFMRIKEAFVFVFVVLVISAPIVAAQPGLVIDSFEDGDYTNDPTWTVSGEFYVVERNAYDGDFSLFANESTTTLSTAEVGFSPSKYSDISFAYNQTTFASSAMPRMFIRDDTATLFGVFVDSGGNVLDQEDSSDTGIDVNTDTQYVFEWSEINYTTNTYNLTVYFENRTVTGFYTGTFDNPQPEIDGILIQTRDGAEFYTDFYAANGSILNGPDPTETTLELDVRKWMPFNSTQDYRVILNETNTTTGHTSLTDVTENATVVSNNTNIVAVNNTTDRLESFNVTGRTFVNATYDGHTSENVNVTVGDRNISNIGIMPPGQWINSFLEVDSTAGGHNIGSPMQWILAIVIIMYTGARMAKNPWVGIGAGLLSSILIWILGFVGLGIVLNTVFVGLLLGVMIMRSRSSSGDTIVTVPGSKKR